MKNCRVDRETRRHAVWSAWALALLSLSLSACGKKTAPPERADPAPPPADTIVGRTEPPIPRSPFESDTASRSIGEPARSLKTQSQQTTATEPTSEKESVTTTPDVDAPSIAPSSAPVVEDASPQQDSTVHHRVVPRRERRHGGH
jgi:predicted small lipoprotein YifL